MQNPSRSRGLTQFRGWLAALPCDGRPRSKDTRRLVQPGPRSLVSGFEGAISSHGKTYLQTDLHIFKRATVFPPKRSLRGASAVTARLRPGSAVHGGRTGGPGPGPGGGRAGLTALWGRRRSPHGQLRRSRDGPGRAAPPPGARAGPPRGTAGHGVRRRAGHDGR